MLDPRDAPNPTDYAQMSDRTLNPNRIMRTLASHRFTLARLCTSFASKHSHKLSPRYAWGLLSTERHYH
eukprot:8900726-Pyramimonas_sp.AAC.2